MKHYREIDILRGIAIIMVFLGHAVIVYPINLENVAWCRGLVAFISAVHMPLFFIVAGFCFHRKSTYVDMVQKKIQRLLIPYTAFNLMDMWDQRESDQDCITWWGILVFICIISYVHFVGIVPGMGAKAYMAAGDCWDWSDCS